MSPETEQRKPKLELQPSMHVHLVGIGGTGLSAIARVLLERGYSVSGSDRQASMLTAELEAAGALVRIGHRPENCDGADVVLASSAIPPDNPELAAARARNIPVLKRAEFLGAMMAGSYGIAVAGSHGKTTTTGMLAQILLEAGLDPTVIVGGVLPSLGSNGRAGQSEYFLVEADEYDYMFLGLQPKISVITNVEYDHPDLYPSPSDYRQAFTQFAQLLPADGRLVVCVDDPETQSWLREQEPLVVRVETYGLGAADWQAIDLRLNQLGGTDFLVLRHDQLVGLARLRVPGEHNVRNALAAVAVASGMGVEFPAIRQALAAFGGVGRRFQVVGEVADVTVVDDYAHHPTEIRATLSAARQRFPGRRIWAVWQPHTFSRTKRLLQEFASSFDNADRVVALDIFQSRETDTLGIDTRAVVASMDHPEAVHVGALDSAASYILERVRPGDVIVTLTAGDGYLVGEAVLQGLQKRLSNGSGDDKMARRTDPIKKN